MNTLTCRCLMALLLSPIVIFSPLYGQFENDQPRGFRFESALSGQLEGGSDYSRLRVQVWDHAGRNAIAEAPIGILGAFDLHGLPAGSYVLRIVTMQNDVIHSETISLPATNTVTVKLKTGEGQTGPARMPVSLARLQHKVPKKAYKMFTDGHKAMAAGKRDEARTSFEAAVKMDPQFFEATNDLGVVYLQDHRLTEAYDMFRRATVIDEADPKAEANLAFVLLAMNRYKEAEDAARSSIRADSMSSRARYLLAVSLLEQKKSPKEILFHLTKAQDQFEPAKKLLKQLEGQGLTPQALAGNEE